MTYELKNQIIIKEIILENIVKYLKRLLPITDLRFLFKNFFLNFIS
jgi:hypothetical protein